MTETKFELAVFQKRLGIRIVVINPLVVNSVQKEQQKTRDQRPKTERCKDRKM